VIAVLVDTDILIEVFRRQDPRLLDRWIALSKSEAMVVYSPVTEAEIFQGLLDHERPDVVDGLASLTCVEIDCHIGRQAGNYLREYKKSHGLLIADALIAATASVHNVRLWTRNRKHFPMNDVRFFG